MISLAVDDNEAVTRLMIKMLRDIDPEGTHLTAGNAENALEIIRQNQIQVLFLDIEMPNLSGIELAKELQKKYPKLNVIFVTGHPEYAYQAHKVHCCGFLTKPVEEQDLIEELERLRPENQRFSVKYGKPVLTVICGKNYQINGEDAKAFFGRDRTYEVFAYLLYKKGMLCSNNELIAVLFGDAMDKQDLLRKYIQDMRGRLREFSAESCIIKRYGKIGINTENIEIQGKTENFKNLFHWYI
jgi:two-component SAPR family response regulator